MKEGGCPKATRPSPRRDHPAITQRQVSHGDADRCGIAAYVSSAFLPAGRCLAGGKRRRGTHANQPLVAFLQLRHGLAAEVASRVVPAHPLGDPVLDDERLGPCHLGLGARGAVGDLPPVELGEEAPHLPDEDRLRLGPARRVDALRPLAVQVVEELPGQQVPRGLRQDVGEELANWVVELAVVVQELAARLGLVKVVVVRLGQEVVQHVLQHLLPAKIVALDVLALVAFEALLERDDQKAAVERLRLVPQLRQRVDALNHEAPEPDGARLLELAVHKERVPGDDGLQGRCVVQVGSRVVLVGDDGRGARERL